MTNYERAYALLSKNNATATCHVPDRIMTYDYVDNTEVLKAYGGYDPSKSYSWEELLEINAKAFHGIGLDATRSVYDPVHHWMQGKVDNWIRFMGVDPEAWKVSEGGDSAWISSRPFSNLEGLQKHMPSIPDAEEIRNWYKPFMGNILKVMYEHDVSFIGAVEGPLCDAYTYVDLELFSLLIYDAPELLTQIIDCCGTYSQTLAQAYTELPFSVPVQFMGEDIAGSTGPIFRPSFVKESVLDWWKRIAEPMRKKNGTFIFHTDGRYGELLPLIFKDFGADGLNPIERAGCNDIFEIFKTYPKVAYFGNVCCEDTLPFGNRYDVEDETLELIEKIGPTGRICIGSSSEVHEQVPLINIETMYGTVHEYGDYPIDRERIEKRRREISPKLSTRLANK
jgi:hypothetical protein